MPHDMSPPPSPAMGPGDLLVAKYNARMSELMHAAMVAETNFEIAAQRAERAERALARAEARIAELEAAGSKPEPGVKIDEQGFPYLATDNAAAEGDEAA